jgi:ketosteroid isomerase-like protein
MSVEENIELVRRFGEALTNRDWAAFNDLVAEGCEWTDVPSGRTLHGREELIAACKTFTTAFPDFSVASVTLIGQGAGRERVERSRNAHWSTPARRRRSRRADGSLVRTHRRRDRRGPQQPDRPLPRLLRRADADAATGPRLNQTRSRRRRNIG